jgi:amidase
MSRPIPTALEAARRIAQGNLTCEALLRICLDRIEAREPAVQAWSHLDADAALAQARRLDRNPRGGLLKGLPVGVKDIIDTSDMPTTYGSQLYQGHRPARDASCVALTRRADGIVLGKTVTTVFAYFDAGKTTNPHDPGHTPGGSSSGSAAAVADGMIPLAFGTQTAASVIRPAAYCGCVGYKPTFGLLDLTGVRPLAVSLDTLGVFAADVADAAFFASVIAGRPRLRVDGQEPAAPRIGLCRTNEWPYASAETRAFFETVSRRLAAGGAKDVVLPASFAGLLDVQATIMAYEAARACAAEVRTDGDSLSPKLRDLLGRGDACPAEDYDAARARADAARRALPAVMADLDVLVTPATPGEAPAGLAGTGDPVFSRVWTLLGVPSVALPAGTGSHGLPLAIQVVGKAGDDARSLAAAAWVERTLS